MKFFRLPPISLSEVGWGQVVLEAAVPCGKFLRLPSGDWTESRCVGSSRPGCGCQEHKALEPGTRGSDPASLQHRGCESLGK